MAPTTTKLYGAIIRRPSFLLGPTLPPYASDFIQRNMAVVLHPMPYYGDIASSTIASKEEYLPNTVL